MNFEETIKKYINEPNTFVFVDQNVYSFWKDRLELNNAIIIESSEENKTLKTIARIPDASRTIITTITFGQIIFPEM